MQNLAGKVAIVTGASKGMGRHFVHALVAEGMNVAALARPSAELDSLPGEFAGPCANRVIAVPCDVADPAAVNAAVAATVDRFGRLDVIVNNAAVFSPFPFADGSDAVIRGQVEVNILGVAWLIRAAIPHLRATSGQIVTISSETVRLPYPMLALYAATKAAIETLSEGLRSELRSENIRVTVLRSGVVAGSSASKGWDPVIAQRFFEKIVETGHAAFGGEAATPESMAEALVALLALPPDVSVDLIELRAAREGMPEGAKAVAK